MTRLSLLLFFSIFIISCAGQSKNESNEIEKAIKIAKDADFRCGLKDNKGRLWFGTYWKGVYCYDGKRLLNFTVKDGLMNNSVLSILEDRNGNIWFGTNTGVCLYNGHIFIGISVSAISYNNYLNSSNSYANSTYSISSVKCLFQDKMGIVWAGAREGMFCYNGTSLVPFLDNNEIKNKNALRLRDVQCIFQDKNQQIWFASGGTGMGEDGICLLNGKTLTNFKPKGYGRGMCILEDKNRNLLFSSGYAVFCYDGKTFTNLAEKANLKLFAYEMLKDKMDNIWLIAENEKLEISLYRYDGKSFSKFTTNENVNCNDFSYMLEDNFGNIWFGTRTSGLYRYNGKMFNRFTE